MLALGGAGYAIVSSFLAPAVWARDTIRDGGMALADFGGAAGPGAIAQELNLTQAQRVQIKSIVAGEKPQIAPLVQQLQSTARQVRSMTDTGAADQSQVQSVIDAEQPTITNLIVDAVRTKVTIYNTVLTPTQQSKARSIMADLSPKIADHIDKLPTMADRFISMAAWRLDLTDAQQSQIRSVVDAGVQKDLPLVQQLNQDREAMVNITGGGQFDQIAVTNEAQSMATTATSLAVDAAMLKSQVFAVLTPAQREKAIAFQSAMRAHRAARRESWTGV